MTQTIYVVKIHHDDDDDLRIKCFKTEESARKYLCSILVNDIQNNLKQFGCSYTINLPKNMLNKMEYNDGSDPIPSLIKKEYHEDFMSLCNLSNYSANKMRHPIRYSIETSTLEE